MNHLVKHGPSFALLEMNLAPNEVVIAEAGAMVAKSTHLGMEVKLNAGRNVGFFGQLKSIVIALVRKMIGGDTFFVNHFSSPKGGLLWLAPALSGAIRHVDLNGQRLMMSAGAYLASVGEVDLAVKWGGLRAILAKEGAFFVEASGKGEVFFTSYGGIEEIDCDGTYIVDNGHIAAFDSSLAFTIKSAGGGLMGLMASGEGLVCQFQGRGKIYIQSRNTGALASWLTPLLPH